MTGQRPLVAFHAPMKGPDHPVPSGDRTVARLYLKALQVAGFEVEIASIFRAYDGEGNLQRQIALEREAAIEAERIAALWQARGRLPDLWFTYHLYHKAPDLLGPPLASRFGLPRAVAEPSHAPKRANGPWGRFYAHAEAAIRAADAVFVATTIDAECIAPLRSGKHLTHLPPFIDGEGWPSAGSPRTSPVGPLRLITVAMMRNGDKAKSYTLLAEALMALGEIPFTLDIVGDGPERTTIEALFAPFGNRIRFHGALTERAALSSLLAAADLYLWPAVNEAYGMAFLEAQLHGLPVLAGAEGGVADVVRNGTTGVLTPKRDASAFGKAVAQLAENRARLRQLGDAARRFVIHDRLLPAAAATLARDLLPLVARRA